MSGGSAGVAYIVSGGMGGGPCQAKAATSMMSCPASANRSTVMLGLIESGMYGSMVMHVHVTTPRITSSWMVRYTKPKRVMCT